MSWLEKLQTIFSPKKSSLSPGSAEFLKQSKKRNDELISILRPARTREQVLRAFHKIANGQYKEAPIAARAAKALEEDSGLDPIRMRDEFLGVLDAFSSATKNL